MLSIFTIALDAEPCIERHLSIFEGLTIPWHWSIVEGASENIGCTAWCRPQKPRLSKDGTTEYLETLKGHPNISIVQKPSWPGKVTMINAALEHLPRTGVLMEIDADEIWTAPKLEIVVQLFKEHSYAGEAQFDCRYFVGPDIITVGQNCFGNNSYEWVRAWRDGKGRFFSRHEPPVFPHKGALMGKALTHKLGMTFDHFAYATEAQVRYKEDFYGYPGAVDGWKRLQFNDKWPAQLKKFLPFVDDKVMATRI